MAYYSNGTNVTSLVGAAAIANAGISSLFQGMNIMTTFDLPNEGFSDGPRIPLTGYTWNGAVIYYINVSLINSLRKNINTIVTGISMTASYNQVLSFSNTLTYPKIYFVLFQARGGAGAFNCGGGSGFYAFHKVVLLPGSSFSVTHRTILTEFKLLGGSAYVDGTYRGVGYSFYLNATDGNTATEDNPGVGFRNGGFPEQINESAPQLAEGGGIAAYALSHDGYACPAYAIYGGQGGKARASSAGFPAGEVAKGIGAGGGGASAARYLRHTGAAERTGGGGALSDPDGNPYVREEKGSFGGGGGGKFGDDYSGHGGDSYTIVFH